MKVKRLLQAANLPHHMVVEKQDGRFAGFYISPARTIAEKDLMDLSHYRALGRLAEEAPDYIYKMYGLEKDKD